MRTVGTLLANYPPDVRALALEARALLLELLPGAEERVDSSGPYVFYGYGPGYTGIVCMLSLSKKGVKLGVAQGAALDDPKGLLEGKGKRHRHVPCKTGADLRRPGLRPLVRAAHAAWRKRTS